MSTTLMVQPPAFDRIPTELRALPRWVTWKAEGEIGKKPRKVPYNPTMPNSRASSNDPATWGTYDQACAAWKEGGRTGVGIVLNGDGLAGVDLDHCVDEHGTPSKLAMTVLNILQAAYIEVGPSGTGLRAFGYAEGLQSGVSGTLNGLHIELYTTGRYLTLTGRTIKAEPLVTFYAFAELADHIRRSRNIDPATGESASATAPPRRQASPVDSANASRSPPIIPQGAELDRLVDDLGSALEFLSADSYTDWFRFGCALKTLGVPGRALWMRWSATSIKHDCEEAGAKWDSLRPDRTGYSAVFASAQAKGWINPGQGARLHTGASVDGIAVDVAACIAASALRKAADGSVGMTVGTASAGPDSEAATADDDNDADGLAGDGTVFAPHLLNPPGMVGEIAKWMQDTAPKPQPVLAVSAALALVGAALANKVRFGSSYTHLYFVNVANSGEGKDRPQKCIADALESAGPAAAAKLPGSQIASGQALMAIGARESTTVLVMDEFGDMLAKATAKTAAPYEREVTTFLKIQWSHAGSVMRGKEFADQKMRPRKDIQYPCINLLGSSTPARFYASITPDEIEDGLLNRMLIVRAANYDGVPIYRDPVPVPENVTGWLAAACSMKPGSLFAVDQPHQPRVVQCSPLAQKTLDGFSAEVEVRRREMLAAPIRRQLAGWWVRASENARRIALILAVARHQDPQDLLLHIEDDAIQIDPTSAQWAVDYVRSIVLDMIEQSASRIGSSELERVVVSVEAKLLKAGNRGLTRREAYRKTGAFAKIFDPILANRVWESVHMRGAERRVYPASGRGQAREVLVSRELKTAGEAV